MRKILVWSSAALVGMLFMSAGAFSQDPLDRDSWNVDTGAWNNDDNWVDDTGAPSSKPTTDGDRWALVDGGVATVSGNESTSGLTIGANGTVEIAAGGSLEVALQDNAFSVGQTEINNRGTLRILGDGSYKGLNGNILGNIEIGQAGSFELSGDANLQGTYKLGVTDAGSPVLKIGGEATLGGTVAPTFTTSPGFGDKFTFVAANSLKLGEPTLELPADLSLPRGLQARIVADGGNANITFENLPILQVDRGTADAKISNVVGGPIELTGYVIESELGTLQPNGFSGFGGAAWDRPNPLPTTVAEFNLTEIKSIAVGEVLDIGKIYNGGPTLPKDEDVTFRFFKPSGEIIEGLVEYTGPANDLVLNVNPDSGEVTIQNLSSFIDPIEVTGYSVISPSESLKVDEWKSLEQAGEAGWLVANPASGFISEVNVSDSTIFNNGTVVSLGNIFDVANGKRDLVLQYTTVTDFLEATVEYQITEPGGCNPVNALLGDLDGNGTVAFADFLVLSTNFNKAVSRYEDGDIDCDGTVGFPDFLQLSTNFNKSLGAVAAVPEPCSLSILGFGGLLMFVIRGRRKEHTAISLGAIS